MRSCHAVIFLCPAAKTLDIACGTIPYPAIELSLVFELLSTDARNDKKAAVAFGEGCHVSPQLFELSHRIDIFMPVSPSFLDLLESNVSGHPLAQISDCLQDFFRVRQIISGEGQS